MESAEFKSSWASNFFTGLGLLLIVPCVFYLSLVATEDDFLNTRVRRGGGIMKAIEQTIGWDLFVALMIILGLFILVMAIVSLWKAFDTKPDVKALSGHLEFHPSVRSSSADYDEVSHWTIEFSNGHPVVRLHLNESYWSLQGMYKRKTIKLEGDKQQLTPLVDFFSRHPIMSQKFVGD